MDLLTMKTAKGGRKISLPWFRQSSVQQSHAALSRQHTIDTPGSFRTYMGSKKLQVNDDICFAIWAFFAVRGRKSTWGMLLWTGKRAENYRLNSITQIIKFRRSNKFTFPCHSRSDVARKSSMLLHQRPCFLLLLVLRFHRHSHRLHS